MNRIFQLNRNKLMLLRNGTRFFPQLCADIDAAQHSVYLETYIFAPDETGRIVSQALQRAALRKVTVRVLLDGYGSADLPQCWVDDLLNAGVEVQWFRRDISPFTLRRSRMRRLRRMHRKMAVIDSEITFIGGINIINDIPVHEDFDAPRLDYAVRIQGELSHEVHAETRHLWEIVKWATLRKRLSRMRLQLLRSRTTDTRRSLELVVRDNVRHRHDIERSYLQAIEQAQHEVIIANAYFLPGRSFRNALKLAAQRGLRVVLLLQGRVEYRLQHYATLALYGQLLDAGIEIYEYRDSYLHAKVGVVDGVWATVGSSNLDPFSLLLAREANLVVRNEEFCGVLRNSLLRAIRTGGQRVERISHSPVSLFMARISYGLIRLLVGLLLRQRH